MAKGKEGETYASAFARRLQYAVYLRQLKTCERQSQDQLGREVSAAMGVPAADALRSASVSRWMLGQSVPDAPTMQAIGAVLEVDPGWLAFGKASTAQAPYNAAVDLAAATPAAPAFPRGPGRPRLTGDEIVKRAKERLRPAAKKRRA